MSKNKLNIAGFDPASRVNLGCAVITLDKSNKNKNVNLITRFTHVFTEDLEHKDHRLVSLETFINSFLDEYKVDLMILERSVGFGKSFVRAQLNEVSGVMKLCALKKNVEIVEYSPGTIKKEIAGHGRASKRDIQKAVMDKFDIKKKDIGTEHECDAVAVAGTHIRKIFGADYWKNPNEMEL